MSLAVLLRVDISQKKIGYEDCFIINLFQLVIFFLIGIIIMIIEFVG